MLGHKIMVNRQKLGCYLVQYKGDALNVLGHGRKQADSRRKKLSLTFFKNFLNSIEIAENNSSSKTLLYHLQISNLTFFLNKNNYSVYQQQHTTIFEVKSLYQYFFSH